MYVRNKNLSVIGQVQICDIRYMLPAFSHNRWLGTSPTVNKEEERLTGGCSTDSPKQSERGKGSLLLKGGRVAGKSVSSLLKGARRLLLSLWGNPLTSGRKNLSTETKMATETKGSQLSTLLLTSTTEWYWHLLSCKFNLYTDNAHTNPLWDSAHDSCCLLHEHPGEISPFTVSSSLESGVSLDSGLGSDSGSTAVLGAGPIGFQWRGLCSARV